MEHFISMYIDNELSLHEKQLFVKQVASNNQFTEEVLELLEQEKILAAVLTHKAPDMALPESPARSSLQTIGKALAACLLLCLSFVTGKYFSPTPAQLPVETIAQATTSQHRFVLYQQGSSQVEIAGSFTRWQRVGLNPTGSNGYWEITLDVPPGEHRYAFIIDGMELVPDPTVGGQEADDFGAINSILIMGEEV